MGQFHVADPGQFLIADDIADNIAFRHHHKFVVIDPQADRSVGKGRRHAVAVTLQMDQAGR